MADIFALSLIFLATTGLFMIKGKKGLTGRGKWFALLGILIPLIFLLLYFLVIGILFQTIFLHFQINLNF
ncbi:MAG: hypothetical protein H6613_13830 [Ignavibacteriales bacterium]|nr:hypothetical protein [Ignavibacteriales bacterium]